MKKEDQYRQSIQKIQNRLPDYMDSFRLCHTLGVFAQCRVMGEQFAGAGLLSAEDCLRLQIAGLLHDISKQRPYEQQLLLCEGCGLDEYQLASPKVLHQTSGAVLARREFGEETDDTILSAIACHTTGKAGMSLFEKLLYLADYIEPNRSFEDCVKLRQMYDKALPKGQKALLTHLDKVVLCSLSMAIQELLVQGAMVDTRTLAAWNDLIYRQRKKES